MAKKSKKKNMKGLIINIVIMALSVLTLLTLFMPIIKSGTVATDIATSATGSDVFTAAFNGEISKDFSDGANMLIGMKTAEENSFVAIVMLWGYVATVFVALGTLAFAVLNIIGLKFKMINTILGACLVIVALATFVFALITAAKNTNVSEIAGYEMGVRTSALISAYMMFAAMIAGGLQVYKARQ